MVRLRSIHLASSIGEDVFRIHSSELTIYISRVYVYITLAECITQLPLVVGEAFALVPVLEHAIFTTIARRFAAYVCERSHN